MARKTAQSYSEIPTINFGDEEGALGKGEEFKGYFKGVKVANTKYGEKNVYTFETEAGTVQIWGSANLNQKMGQVKLGSLTFIEYQGLGKKEKGKNPAKLFLVEYDDEDTIDVDVPQVSFTNDDSGDEGEEENQDEGGEEEQEETPPARQSKPQASKPQASQASKPAASGNTSSAKAKLDAMLNKNKQRASA